MFFTEFAYITGDIGCLKIQPDLFTVLNEENRILQVWKIEGESVSSEKLLSLASARGFYVGTSAYIQIVERFILLVLYSGKLWSYCAIEFFRCVDCVKRDLHII